MFTISPHSLIFFGFILCAFSGNHERDWPGSGSFYGTLDSGGECGVLAQTMFYVPAENREKFWYAKSIILAFLFIFVFLLWIKACINVSICSKHQIYITICMQLHLMKLLLFSQKFLIFFMSTVNYMIGLKLR
jgi:hypothetical protein